MLFLKLVCIQSPAISQLPFKYPYLMLLPTVVSAVSQMCSLYLPILKILSHLFCDLNSLVYLKRVVVFFICQLFFVFVFVKMPTLFCFCEDPNSLYFRFEIRSTYF